MEGHFVARNGKGESSKMSGGHVPAESLPWGKEAQPAPIARTLERKPSQKFRRAAWKIGRTHSAKPKFDISKVIRAWKVKNEVPRCVSCSVRYVLGCTVRLIFVAWQMDAADTGRRKSDVCRCETAREGGGVAQLCSAAAVQAASMGIFGEAQCSDRGSGTGRRLV